jgi:hypothetical protein
MEQEDTVLIQARVPRWVRDGLKREAAKERRTVSNLLAVWLLDSCVDYPENPANQPQEPYAAVAEEPLASAPYPRAHTATAWQ